jgi:uncharacterized protein (TIGR00255 family)
MTGFARARRSLGAAEVVLSVKSVNHRGLDLHFHMPAVFDPFEQVARAAVKKQVERGHLQIHLTLDKQALDKQNGSVEGSLNVALLERWVAAFREAARQLGSPEQPAVADALRVPGILQTDSSIEWTPEVECTLTDCLEEALNGLNEFRDREGAAIAEEMAERARSLGKLASKMEKLRSNATEAFHLRLKEKLADLLHGAAVEPHRLAQEAAILADRSDISEEIMRLKTHALQVLEMIRAPGEKGKKLDFLLQEMNRESNTILSKTSGLGDHGLTLTALALEAKSEIDKMREQSLNLE